MRLAIASILLQTALLAWPCSAAEGDSAAPPQAIPLCTVLANATKYDGKEVTVRGLYRMVIHGSILLHPDCPTEEVNVRRVADWKANKKAAATLRAVTKKDRFQAVDIVSRGIFKIAHEGQCFGQGCLPYEFDESELLSAMPVGGHR
jgi:hypothetical protein